jgi:2-hydroxychromene-2-carboxylate isomerase
VAESEPARLEFWFDFASTYSYVAAMRIERLCADAGIELGWRPFLLGPIFALQGWNDSHFNLNPRRGTYMWRDLERLTTKFGLPWRQPSQFPRSSTRAARVACHVADASWAGEFIRRTFTANFGEDRDIGERSAIAEILVALQQDPELVLGGAEGPARRGLLRANTERAIALGIFGAPNCLVEGELFWGEESLEDAVAWARRADAPRSQNKPPPGPG